MNGLLWHIRKEVPEVKKENRAVTVAPFQPSYVTRKPQVSSCRNRGIRLIPEMVVVARFISCVVFHLLVSFKLTTIPIVEFNSSRKIKCMQRTVEKVGEYTTTLPALSKGGVQFHPF